MIWRFAHRFAGAARTNQCQQAAVGLTQQVGDLRQFRSSPDQMFRYRRWVEVEALYVASGYRRMGIAQRLLDRAYRWAGARGLSRVQLYVTASNVRAQSVYTDQGFTVAQAIMRKSL